MPDALLHQGLMAWAALFGTVSFELFGQLHGIVGEQPGDREAYFTESVQRWAAQLGITPGRHRPGSPQARTPAGARLAQTAATAGAINSNASQIAEEAST